MLQPEGRSVINGNRHLKKFLIKKFRNNNICVERIEKDEGFFNRNKKLNL